ncbi:MAG TPA: metallophosphoesterase [Pseudobdellovibrionaceae bacterium]|nr:metallophosphoesterase [Pseudobdellovibrionaceae bacterium]
MIRRPQDSAQALVTASKRESASPKESLREVRLNQHDEENLIRARRLLVLTDLHGNLEALRATEKFAREELGLKLVDGPLVEAREDEVPVVVTGDFVNPLPDSVQMLRLIRSREWTCLKGNHEDYISVVRGRREMSGVDRGWRFFPVELAARSFAESDLEWMESLPDLISIDDILFFHCGLHSNRRSDFRDWSSRRESIALGGHWHRVIDLWWSGKRIYFGGSCGIPLREDGRGPRPEFTVLEQDAGGWRPRSFDIGYDPSVVVNSWRGSGDLERGGPTAWALAQELMTGQRRLSPLMRWLRARHPGFENWDVARAARVCRDEWGVSI